MTQPTILLPLIRKTDAGWERLVIGSAAAGAPRWESCAWDHPAWQERQRQAERARRAAEMREAA